MSTARQFGPWRGAFLSVLVFLYLSGPAWADYGEGEAAYYQGDFETAFRELMPLAMQGNADAQGLIGDMYIDGTGVAQDYLEAAAWYGRAAEQGDAYGQYSLALMYDEGNDVPQSYEMAAKWYFKAAEQGYPFAQNNLAVLYQYGQGVPQDLAKAYFLYAAAAFTFSLNEGVEEGEEEYRAIAAENRDKLAKRMSPEELEEAHRQGEAWLGLELD